MTDRAEETCTRVGVEHVCRQGHDKGCLLQELKVRGGGGGVLNGGKAERGKAQGLINKPEQSVSDDPSGSPILLRHTVLQQLAVLVVQENLPWVQLLQERCQLISSNARVEHTW